MANIRIDAGNFDALARALREIPGKVQAAIVRAADALQRDALAEWRRVTPRRTGALQDSLRVSVTRGGNGFSLRFDTEPPGDDYYGSVNRRYRMTQRLFAWLRRNVRLYVKRELDTEFQGGR